jgi:antitoxin component YwqK of YwqJK toxin-antitoxin module
MFSCKQTPSGRITDQWRLLLVLLLLIPFYFGCSSPVTHSETYKRGSRVYRVKTEKPFTGVVVGKDHKNRHHRRLRFEKTYVDGLQDGVTRYWYKNGQLESVIPYEKGKIDGIVVRYYQNGNRRSKIHYVKGMRGGDQGEVFWSPDGEIQKG